jgi:hypothetical protein
VIWCVNWIVLPMRWVLSRLMLFGSFVTVLCQQNGILVAVWLEVKCWFCLPRFYM